MMDKFKKGQIIYILMPNGTFKKAKILEIEKEDGKFGDKELNPDYYMRLVSRYLDCKTNGTVSFYPMDFEKIVFEKIPNEYARTII